MIRLISRNEIIETKKIISSEITALQKVFFDKETLQFYIDDNEEHLYRKIFDLIDAQTINYSRKERIISINHSEISSFTIKLSEKLAELFNEINITELIIISHLKIDFFGNRLNKFNPLKKAYKQLEKIVGNTTYDESFTLETNDLSEFIDVLFWIERCDPSAPEYIFIFDKDEQIQIHLCKYGKIHFTEFKKKRFTNKKLKELGWQIIKGQEFDNFSDDGRIIGRQIVL